MTNADATCPFHAAPHAPVDVALPPVPTVA